MKICEKIRDYVNLFKSYPNPSRNAFSHETKKRLRQPRRPHQAYHISENTRNVIFVETKAPAAARKTSPSLHAHKIDEKHRKWNHIQLMDINRNPTIETSILEVSVRGGSL